MKRTIEIQVVDKRVIRVQEEIVASKVDPDKFPIYTPGYLEFKKTNNKRTPISIRTIPEKGNLKTKTPLKKECCSIQ